MLCPGFGYTRAEDFEIFNPVSVFWQPWMRPNMRKVEINASLDRHALQMQTDEANYCFANDND